MTRTSNSQTSPHELGVIVGLSDQPEQVFTQVAELGLETCQLSCWNPAMLDQALAGRVREAAARHQVRISSFWAGYSGPAKWNFIDGPTTIGLVPPDRRAGRVEELKQGAQFARWIDAPSITTHVGFIHEDPNHPDYAPLIEAISQVGRRCGELGVDFQFETGQETPVTLLRVIEDVGLDNLRINLDPANLILYGKANPVDALDVFGSYVAGVHAKDGCYPTNGRSLGKETALGEGKVDFPRLVSRLEQLGYDGPLTIEREISGPEQRRDIERAITYLRNLRG